MGRKLSKQDYNKIKRNILKKLYSNQAFSKGHLLYERLTSGIPPHLTGFVKDILDERIIDVRYTEALTDSPCRLMSQGAAAFTHMLRYMNEDYTPQAKIMELNANHPVISGLKEIYEKDPDSSLLKQSIIQLLENQELVEGNLQDPAGMANRITSFIQQLLEK